MTRRGRAAQQSTLQRRSLRGDVGRFMPARHAAERDAIFALRLRFGRWRYKRYQLDAERHRADTKGMYRGRTGRAGNGLLLFLKLIFSQPLHARRES
jgi:hypothetical protein